jgi:hypothetical protein
MIAGSDVYSSREFAHRLLLDNRRIKMQKKKTFSTMEIVLLGVLVGSLILSFWQGRQEEKGH